MQTKNHEWIRDEKHGREISGIHKSLSTTGIFDLNHPQKYIKYAADAGFGRMMLDLGMFYSEYDLENYGNDCTITNEKKAHEHFDLFIGQARSCAISFDAVRVPHLRWDTKRTDLNDLLVRIGGEAISVCKEICCPYIIIQPLFSGIAGCDRWKKNFDFYKKLGNLARQNNVCILLENQCDNVNGHLVRGMCADGSMSVRLIDALNHEFGSELFGFCLDTKACTLCGQDMGELAVKSDKRLKAVFLRECEGINESDSLPRIGCGNIKWLKLIRGLRSIEYNGIMVIDSGDFLRSFSHLLRPQFYPLIKSVIDFFCWQIEMVQQLKKFPDKVLFGAGNMCQSYMEHYGQTDPPLFICDNNEKLWGTKVCGVDVKSPEALRKLPKDCGIVICNIFYEEITEQLKSMRIISPIMYFNDELL